MAGLVDEWKVARDTISAIDERIHDLRKTGITIVTALAAVQGLVESPGSATSSYVPPSVKLALIGATLLLLCSLASMEHAQRLDQRGAIARARQIEARIGLDLTETVDFFSEVYRVPLFVQAIYYPFVIAVGALGFFVINPATLPQQILCILDVIITIVAVIYISYVFHINYDLGLLAWDTSSRRLAAGDPLEVHVLNLSHKDPCPVEPGQDAWCLSGSDGHILDQKKWTSNEKRIEPCESKAWQVETKGAAPGVYKLHFYAGEGKPLKPSMRVIVIFPKETRSISQPYAPLEQSSTAKLEEGSGQLNLQKHPKSASVL